jgi:dihydrofolate reductase
LGVSRRDFSLQSLLMRRIVLGLGISLDGYIARLDGTVDFLFMPKDYSMGPFFKTVDTALMGRKTYEAGLRTSGGSFSTYGLITYVCSRSLPPGERNGLIFTSDSPKVIVAALRKSKGKNIWHMGGGELVRAFLQDDLVEVDELYLGVIPKLIGEGLPLFPAGFPERRFRLLESKTFSQSLITLKYEASTPSPNRSDAPVTIPFHRRRPGQSWALVRPQSAAVFRPSGKLVQSSCDVPARGRGLRRA